MGEALQGIQWRDRLRCIRQRAKVGCLIAEIEESRGEHHASDAIGDGVMELEHDRCAVAVETGGHGQFPERAIAVKVLFRCALRDAQRAREVLFAGREGDPAQVVVEIEVGIRDPARRDERHRIADDALSQLGHDPGEALHPLGEGMAVGHRLGGHHCDDDRSQQRIVLDAPHDGVEGAHALVLAHLRSLPVLPVWGSPDRSARIRPVRGLTVNP